MIYHFFPDHEDAYPPEHEHIEDEQAQADDQRELQERLERILRNIAKGSFIVNDTDLRTLCTACGIDVRNVM